EIDSLAPGGGASRRCHQIGEDSQRRCQRDPACEEDTEVAAEYGGSMKIQNPADERQMRERFHDRTAHLGTAQEKPAAADECDNRRRERRGMRPQEIRKRKEAEHDRVEFGIEVAQYRAKLRQHESQEKEKHG